MVLCTLTENSKWLHDSANHRRPHPQHLEVSPIPLTNGGTYDPSSDPELQARMSLLTELQSTPFVRVRLGDVKVDDRKSTDGKTVKHPPNQPYKPRFSQKQVDMMLGLDLIWLSLKKIGDAIVVVSGDTDFLEPIRMATKEGTHVFLAPLGGRLAEQLRLSADAILPLTACDIDHIQTSSTRIPRTRGRRPVAG